MTTGPLDPTAQGGDKGEGVLNGSHDVVKEGRGGEVKEASGEGVEGIGDVGSCEERKGSEGMVSYAEVKEIAAGVKEDGEMVEGGSGDMVSSEEMGNANTDILTSVLVGEVDQQCSEALPTSTQATPTTDTPQPPAEPLTTGTTPQATPLQHTGTTPQATPLQDTGTTPQATPFLAETVPQAMPLQAGISSQATPLQIGTTPPVAEAIAADQQLAGMDVGEDRGGEGVGGEGGMVEGVDVGATSEGTETRDEEMKMEIEKNMAIQEDLAGPGKGWLVGVASTVVTQPSTGAEGAMSAGGGEVASEGGEGEEGRAGGEEGAGRHREGEGEEENCAPGSEQEKREEESEQQFYPFHYPHKHTCAHSLSLFLPPSLSSCSRG